MTAIRSVVEEYATPSSRKLSVSLYPLNMQTYVELFLAWKTIYVCCKPRKFAEPCIDINPTLTLCMYDRVA